MLVCLEPWTNFSSILFLLLACCWSRSTNYIILWRAPLKPQFWSYPSTYFIHLFRDCVMAKSAYWNKTLVLLLSCYQNEQILLLRISNYIPIIAFECHIPKSTWVQGPWGFLTKFIKNDIITCNKSYLYHSQIPTTTSLIAPMLELRL